MWKALAALFVQGVSMLLELGHKPSREDAIEIAKALLRDEFMARVIADEIDEAHRAAVKVQEAFTPDGSVPDLLAGIEGEVVHICPVESCSKRAGHADEHGVDL